MKGTEHFKDVIQNYLETRAFFLMQIYTIIEYNSLYLHYKIALNNEAK